MNTKRPLLFAAALLCTACGPQMHTVVFTSPYPARTAPEDIRIYSAVLPECRFEELALVTAEDGLSFEDLRLKGMREEAAALGGDAIIGIHERISDYEDVEDTLTGTVIRFTERDCRHE